MAINDETLNNNGTRFGDKPQEEGGFSPFASFHSGSMFGQSIRVGVGSESYNKMKERLTTLFKTASPKLKLALLDLDNVNSPSLRFSSLIVAAQLNEDERRGVTYHILLLASTSEELAPVYEQINNQQVEILRVPSDAVDATLIKEASDVVSKAFPGVKTVFCDATVVPTTFNMEDKAAIDKLASNAVLACTTELEIMGPTFKDLNLVRMSDRSQLTANLTFGRETFDNAVGEPVRSDIRINLTSKKNGQKDSRQSVNSADREVTIFKASGFIDLVWSPADPYGQMNPWMQQNPLMGQMPMMTQKYSGRMVITDLQSNYAYTPAAIMFAIAVAMTAGENNNWFQTYRPSANQNNRVDHNDIGALNIEANLMNETDKGGFGTRVNTHAEDFRLVELGKYISALVRPGMLLALDCPDSGPQSFYLSVFAAAARGSSTAYATIYDALNELSGGAFQRHFPQGTPMFIDVDNRVHLGHYLATGGVKRDVRDFDHLAVCNQHGEQNPAAIRDFSDTYLRSEYPLAQRLAARKRMISAMSNETAVFTGMAWRVTFSAPLLRAIALSMKETALPLRVQTPLSMADFNNTRGVGSFVEQGLMAPGMTFQQASVYANNSSFYGGGFQGTRW